MLDKVITMMEVKDYGVVPSLDDLEWEWEAPPDGVLLQDSLLCSVLPSLQKPSAVFVESNLSINDGFGQHVDLGNMELNESWYNNAPNSTPLNQELVQLPTSQPQPYNYSETNFKVNNISMELDYHAPLPANQFQHEDSMNFFVNSREQNSGTMEVDQSELDGRRSAQSAYSSSSWESYAEDASQTTELSQEEIYEEIQRECAEIERRSVSPSSAADLQRKTLKKSRRGTGNRKKELNRVAAAKYREKKRLERDEKQRELRDLESRNRNLKTQVNSLENEIKYLKDLISEIGGRN